MTANDIAVIYIARGSDNGLVHAKCFLDSYLARQPGHPHRLIVITKGWRSEVELAKLHSLFAGVHCEMLPLPDDGFDLGAYFRAARHLTAPWLLCLNTHSEILADDWVKKLFDCVRDPKIGAAGATGSWASHTTIRLREPGPNDFLGKFRKFFELCWYRYHFPRFPNPHLRTNAFMMRRDDLLKYSVRVQIPLSKERAWVIESGRSGLTAFLRRENLAVVVCGADGRSFPVKEWFASQTYFSSHQTNLLVGDSQTRRYQHSSRKYQGGMQVSAWGQVDDTVL